MEIWEKGTAEGWDICWGVLVTEEEEEGHVDVDGVD
jgi:hypothetical protein